MKKTFLLSALLLPFFSFAQEAPKPYGVLPSERQLLWHEMEMYCLIHYTPTTFQDKEWGYGDADPKIFAPTKFDASQIAKAAAAGGFKGLISVAKHHDGFCLWPTATTSYSVKSSPWKNGQGDMVYEFMKASHAHNMKFGVYLSAWDRNDMRYGTDAYTDAYREQLTELLSNYGELFTSWHDGANGGDGYYGGLKEKRTIDRQTYYQWDTKTFPIIRKLQPLAMIFSDVGPDMRWVGNEKGFAGETSWATFTPKGFDSRKAVPGDSDHTQAPYGTRNGEYWIPAECDVPQRPGWFYHENQNSKVKTPNQLFDIYLKSVGRGANMNLGLAPMPEGYLHANDVKSLTSFGKKLKNTFSKNLAVGAKAKASDTRGNKSEFDVKNIFDDDRYSYYASSDNVLNPTIEITLSNKQIFDIIRLRENIKLGQRIDSVNVEVFTNDKWEKLATATSIGANRLIKLSQPIETNKLRVQLFAPVAPTLSDFALFKEYDEPFEFDGNTQKYTKLDKQFYSSTSSIANVFFDQNPTTFGRLKTSSKDYDVIFQLKKPIVALSYLPRQDGKKEGNILKYKVQGSADGKVWKTIKSGEFSNINANPVEQIIDFGAKISYKYLKLISVETDSKVLTIAEINFYE